jgi:neutral ceramidase
VRLAEGELEGANINRSPTSYALNPDAADYAANTDLNMLLLSVTGGADGLEPLGALNWFAVHGTSLNNTNRLLSGDNRGYASYAVEQRLNGASEHTAPGRGPFVAAFASTNLGDVSPNTLGAKCSGGPDEGLPCDPATSTCPDGHGQRRNELCLAYGPGVDMYDSARIIGGKQAAHALDLLNSTGTVLTVRARLPSGLFTRTKARLGPPPESCCLRSLHCAQ